MQKMAELCGNQVSLPQKLALQIELCTSHHTALPLGADKGNSNCIKKNCLKNKRFTGKSLQGAEKEY